MLNAPLSKVELHPRYALWSGWTIICLGGSIKLSCKCGCVSEYRFHMSEHIPSDEQVIMLVLDAISFYLAPKTRINNNKIFTTGICILVQYQQVLTHCGRKFLPSFSWLCNARCKHPMTYCYAQQTLQLLLFNTDSSTNNMQKYFKLLLPAFTYGRD